LQISLFALCASFAFSSVCAARKLHSDAASSVLRSPGIIFLKLLIISFKVAFFDVTPMGRVINRFSKDQDSIDNTLSDSVFFIISLIYQIVKDVPYDSHYISRIHCFDHLFNAILRTRDRPTAMCVLWMTDE
jgi:ABC-type multidrug transport system fused ATPase/permease subunit